MMQLLTHRRKGVMRIQKSTHTQHCVNEPPFTPPHKLQWQLPRHSSRPEKKILLLHFTTETKYNTPTTSTTRIATKADASSPRSTTPGNKYNTCVLRFGKLIFHITSTLTHRNVPPQIKTHAETKHPPVRITSVYY